MRPLYLLLLFLMISRHLEAQLTDRAIMDLKTGRKVDDTSYVYKQPSGNTGYSAFPHLHFQVNDSSGRQILTRFYTRRGIKYLRPGNWYKSVQAP